MAFILSDIIYTFYILSVSLLQKSNMTANTLNPGVLRKKIPGGTTIRAVLPGIC